MRLFVAVELPPVAAALAADVSHALRERQQASAPRARVTWIPVDRMHVTVRFLGNVDTALAAAVVDRLSAPLELPTPFLLTLGDPGAFPPRGKPAVLWLGIDQGAWQLTQIEEQVSNCLRPVGFAPEERAYHPHVTLARVREPHGLRATVLFDGLQTPANTGGIIDAITLFESRLSPKGPVYHAIHRTPLPRA